MHPRGQLHLVFWLQIRLPSLDEVLWGLRGRGHFAILFVCFCWLSRTRKSEAFFFFYIPVCPPAGSFCAKRWVHQQQRKQQLLDSWFLISELQLRVTVLQPSGCQEAVAVVTAYWFQLLEFSSTNGFKRDSLPSGLFSPALRFFSGVQT